MAEFELWSNHRECLGSNGNPKLRYYSEKEAENMARYLLTEKNLCLRVYRCNDCGYWHLTKTI